jgi:hypothetical protein
MHHHFRHPQAMFNKGSLSYSHCAYDVISLFWGVHSFLVLRFGCTWCDIVVMTRHDQNDVRRIESSKTPKPPPTCLRQCFSIQLSVFLNSFVANWRLLFVKFGVFFVCSQDLIVGHACETCSLTKKVRQLAFKKFETVV